MSSLHVEVALQMTVEPSQGLVFTLIERRTASLRVIRRWVLKARSVTPAEWEDVTSALVSEVTEHLIIGPGLQLALLD